MKYILTDTVFNIYGKPDIVNHSEDLRAFEADFEKYEYNKQGLLLKITGYNKLGEIKCFSYDIAIQTFLYDDKRLLIEQRNYKSKDSLVSGKYETTPNIRYKYDNDNHLTETWYLNENESLQTSYSIAHFEKDSTGKKVFKGWFNKDGIMEE